MATCQECLHFEACSTIYEKAFREKPEKYTFLSACPLFKNKANYAEVLHGEWVSLTECANAGVYCSVCHKKVYKEDYAWCSRKNKLRSNYCPNCGARMDGGNEDV